MPVGFENEFFHIKAMSVNNIVRLIKYFFSDNQLLSNLHIVKF